MRYIISLLLCISFIYNISAQEPKSQNLLYADKYFEVEDYYLAAEFYQKVLDKEPQHAFAMYRLAECNMHFFDYDKAEIWFQRCYNTNPNKYPKALYYHALMLKTNGKYLQATANFEKFIAIYQSENDNDTYSELALLHYNGCLLALDVLKKPVRDYRFTNPGEGVNTSFSEFAPAVNQHDSSIVIASSRLTDKKEEVYGRFGEGYLNNYRFEKGEEDWILITKETLQDNFEVVNSKFNDGAGVFNTEKDKYYFTRCNEANADRTDFNCAIFVTSKVNEKWQTPVKLNENINPKGYWNAHPSLTINADTMFFVSKRPGGFGQHDIYYSTLENLEDPNSWGKAINMGDKVNTPYIEMSPSYYSEEKILFFASNGHEGFGGLDIFMAKENFSKIVNIGLPFNSNRDDFYFVLGDLRGYLTSNREGGFGNDDIYTFDITSRETLIAEIESDSIVGANTISIRGRILDDDGNPAPDVTVLLTDTLGNVLKMTMTDDNGVFLFANLDPSIDYRIILQDDDGRLTTEILYKIDDIKVFANKDEVNTTSLKDAATSTIASRVLFENIYFDFDKSHLRPESIKVLDELAKYSTEHKNLKIEVSGHTDSKGSVDYNLKLAKRRGDAAYNYLVSKGVKKSNIIVNAIGLSSPIASNENEVGRQLNRRVEFHIVGGGSFEATAMVYVVEPRVTLQEVAKKHNMSVEELKQMNNLTNDELDAYTPVRVRRTGDEDIISPLTMMSAKKSTDTKSSNKKASKKHDTVSGTTVDNDKYVIINHAGYAEGVKYSKYDNSGYYIVLPRNTLFSIAKVCDVTPEQIIELNDLQNQTIYPGQKLRISPDVSKPVTEVDNMSSMADAGIKVSDQQGRTVKIGDEKRYVVKDGDTLYNICKQFNITMDQARIWNNLDSYIVRPGMVLRVKE